MRHKEKDPQVGEVTKKPLYTTDKTIREYLNNPRDTRTEANKRIWYGILKGK